MSKWFDLDKVKENLSNKTMFSGMGDRGSVKIPIKPKDIDCGVIGDIEVWPDLYDNDVPKFISFNLNDCGISLFKDRVYFELFLSDIRKTLLSDGVFQNVVVRDMSPYMIVDREDLRLVLASENLNGPAMPYTLVGAAEAFGPMTVIHPNRESLSDGVGKKGKGVAVTYDLANLADLKYRIRFRNDGASLCVIYDNKYKASGATFHLLMEDGIAKENSIDIIFVAVSVWDDGPFIGDERHSPLFSPLSNIYPSTDDINVLPLILNFANTFLVEDTLISLLDALEGRLVWKIIVNKEDRLVVEKFARINKPIAEFVVFGDEQVVWGDIAENVSHEDMRVEIKRMERKSIGANKKKVSLEEILASKRRLPRR